MKQNKRTNSSRLGSIWLVVFLLIIMVLASACLLGTFINRYVGGEKNVISVMIDGNALSKEYNDDSLSSGAEPSINASWETDASVDLFKNTYVGADGKITVASADGSKVIAPGTSNTYEFSIKNTGNISLDCSLALKGVFKIADMHLPFYVRLRQGDKWIVGGENEWLHVNELGNTIDNVTLPRDKSATYFFEWMWPYEADDEANKLVGDLSDTLAAADKNDTEIGSITEKTQANFHLDISITSVVTPTALPVFGDGTPVWIELLTVVLSGALILGSGIWLIIIFWRRRLYFTGIVSTVFEGEITLGRKSSEMKDGRFVFPRARFGKRTLALDTVKCGIQFRSRKVECGVRFEQKDGRMQVTVDRKIRAVELFITDSIDELIIRTDKWAAIDKKRNLYTPEGVIPPVDDKNATPSGLCVDEDNKFYISEVMEGMNNGTVHKERESESV